MRTFRTTGVKEMKLFPTGLMVSSISFVILVALSIMLVQSAQAQKVVASDDFTDIDGSAPDSKMWTVHNEHANDYVRIESNTVRTHVVDSGHSYIMAKDAIDTERFTISIDWRPRLMYGRPANIVISTGSTGIAVWWITVMYDADYWGFGIDRMYGGSGQSTFSMTTNAVKDQWYVWEIDVVTNRVNVTCKERGTGTEVYSKLNLPMDPFPGDAIAQFGVFASINWHDPQANYDNFDVTDHTGPAHLPPVWGPLPIFNAVEDTPFVYNFNNNVSDPDTPSHGLSITSSSPYVSNINRLVVTFLFPDPGTELAVSLFVTDEAYDIETVAVFNVKDVNDPPSHDIVGNMMAVEDVPLRLDLSANVWDDDSDILDIYIKVDDPYAVADRLNLTLTFTEGVLQYDLYFNLTDGLADTEVHVNFTVEPVDDPPIISPLGEFSAMENVESKFNLTPFLTDLDTPIYDLQVMVRSPNCTVEGQILRFNYADGDLDVTVLVEVTDGHSMSEATLLVQVEYRNDAPFVHTISPRGFVEDEEKTIDLSMYIEDEDTPIGELTLSSDDPAVVDINGFSLTLLFTSWLAEHEVVFRVSDGDLSTEGRFLIQVQEKNDPPKIVGLGDLVAPFDLEVDENSVYWYDIIVVDDDDQNFEYSIKCFWGHVEALTNDTLKIAAARGDVGEYAITLTVQDKDGGKDEIDFIIKVINIDDPPTNLVILTPTNHTIVEEGANLTFSISVLDPDMELGQVLTVTWTSDISGILETRNSDGPLKFSTTHLELGTHRITITVTDGTHVVEAWHNLTVVKGPRTATAVPSSAGPAGS